MKPSPTGRAFDKARVKALVWRCLECGIESIVGEPYIERGDRMRCSKRGVVTFDLDGRPHKDMTRGCRGLCEAYFWNEKRT